jgi:hypothetical protein
MMRRVHPLLQGGNIIPPATQVTSRPGGDHRNSIWIHEHEMYIQGSQSGSIRSAVALPDHPRSPRILSASTRILSRM